MDGAVATDDAERASSVSSDVADLAEMAANAASDIGAGVGGSRDRLADWMRQVRERFDEYERALARADDVAERARMSAEDAERRLADMRASVERACFDAAREAEGKASSRFQAERARILDGVETLKTELSRRLQDVMSERDDLLSRVRTLGAENAVLTESLHGLIKATNRGVDVIREEDAAVRRMTETVLSRPESLDGADAQVSP